MKFLLLLTLWLPTAFAKNKIQNINNEIRKHGAEWTAGENDISRMNVERFARMLGAPPEQNPEIRFEAKEQGTLAVLPKSLDWRNRAGLDYSTPVMHQGDCGSCVTFAAVATLETQYKIHLGQPNKKVRLSTQHLLSCGGGSCYWGWTGQGAANFLQSRGVPDEACYKYTSGTTGSTGSCSGTCRDWAARSLRINSSTRPSGGAVDNDAVKRALQKGPVFSMFSLYDDLRYYRSGVYRHVSGSYVSGHAVSIVGYNDVGRYWIVRNSWGTTWGEQGYFRVSYDDTSGIARDTWSYNLGVTTKALADIPATRLAVDWSVAGANRWDIQIGSDAARVERVTFHARGPAGEITKRVENAARELRLTWDKTGLAPGAYEVWVSVESGGLKAETARREITLR